MSEIDKLKYREFLGEIKNKIYRSQYEALKLVNKQLVNLYWDIGKSIAERQKLYGWGKSVVENLSKDLQAEFPGIKGFSVTNLWRAQTFYNRYGAGEIPPPMVGEIGWSHNVVIMEKCKNDQEREFYIRMASKHRWSKIILGKKIDNNEYQKYLDNQTNFEQSLPGNLQEEASSAVKDEYSFDFLALGEEYFERQLEAELIKNVQKFLSEIGEDFCFVANQYRLEVADREFFVDLLLYHRKLRCLVAIELKKGEFQPEHTGKMNFYLSVLNDKVRYEDENPSIGIVICQSKHRTIVEYALKDTTKPMGVAAYEITKNLPDKLKGYLPTPEKIAEQSELLECI